MDIINIDKLRLTDSPEYTLSTAEAAELAGQATEGDRASVVRAFERVCGGKDSVLLVAADHAALPTSTTTLICVYICTASEYFSCLTEHERNQVRARSFFFPTYCLVCVMQ